MIGDWLYQLLPRDLQGQAHTFHLDGAASAGLATTRIVDLDFPDDRMLIITLITIRANAGAAQTVSDMQLSICDLNSGGGVCRVIWRDQSAAAQNKNFTLLPANLIIVPPRSLEAFAEFNAAVASNAIDLIVCGYTLPRGSFVP